VVNNREGCGPIEFMISYEKVVVNNREGFEEFSGTVIRNRNITNEVS
jgi:hypothetical protein